MEQKELGEKIKSLRSDRGMSQQALAERIDVSFQMVQKYEKGTSNISVRRLEMMARAFEIPVTEFFLQESPEVSSGDIIGPTELNDKERQLLLLFRKIKDENVRAGLLRQMKGLTEQGDGQS